MNFLNETSLARLLDLNLSNYYVPYSLWASRGFENNEDEDF